MNSTIILIGPIHSGKGTIAELLAEKLGMPRYELDEHRWSYYDEIGYDRAVASQIRSDEGILGLLLGYWKPFEVHAVERALAEHRDCVIDFGAGHSVQEDEELFSRVQRALAPYPHVILLLPSPDVEESVHILNERFGQMLMREMGEINQDLLAVNEHFVRHPSNRTLAKMVFYTKNKTPDETCAEIVTRLKSEIEQPNSA